MTPVRGGAPLSRVCSLRPHADVGAVPAHAARRPGRRRGRQPPPARPGRATSGGSPPASTPGSRSGTGCCARSSRSCARRWIAPAPRRRCCRSSSRSSCGSGRGRDAAYGPLMFRLDRPQGDGVLPRRPRPRRSMTTIVAQEYTSYRDLPREPVPDQLEVPRRAPAPLRPAARARVPDEGRVLVRRRRRRRCA